jgi:hypothetical protein
MREDGGRRAPRGCGGLCPPDRARAPGAPDRFLTENTRARYDRVVFGGEIIPPLGSKDVGTEAYGFDRLERAVAALVEQHERMLKENGELRRELAERSGRVRVLEEQVLEANQRRKDVVKRVDELIAQIDQLDTQLGIEESP